MSWAKILVIDDDPVIVQLGRQALEPDGFEVFAASSAGEGLALVQAEAPDLILTDLTLPDMSGFELCKRLQQDPQLCHIPIIIVTSRRRESDLVLSLGLGADDYVLKPFGPSELLARVNAVLRRVRRCATPSPRLERAGLLLDPDRHEVRVEGARVDLTATEFRLLYALAVRPGHVLSRRQLVRLAIDQQVAERTIDVHVRAIRRKLGAHRRMVETVRGVGYRFNDTNV